MLFFFKYFDFWYMFLFFLEHPKSQDRDQFSDEAALIFTIISPLTIRLSLLSDTTWYYITLLFLAAYKIDMVKVVSDSSLLEESHEGIPYDLIIHMGKSHEKTPQITLKRDSEDARQISYQKSQVQPLDENRCEDVRNMCYVLNKAKQHA